MGRYAEKSFFAGNSQLRRENLQAAGCAGEDPLKPGLESVSHRFVALEPHRKIRISLQRFRRQAVDGKLDVFSVENAG